MARAKDDENGVGEGAPASGKEAVDEALSEREPARGPDRHRWVALAIAALVLFPGLARSGIWDPYELDAGDLARRIALRVFHAGAMDLPGAAAGLPTLTDLRMAYAFAPAWKVELSANNIFDRRYETARYYNQPERNWMLTLRYQPRS